MAKKDKKQALSPWKKLALTNEEIEGMPRDQIQVHLSEQVTTPMPWLLNWFGQHWRFVIISTIGAILIVIISLAIAYKGDWLIKGWTGLVWFLDFIFIRIVGWAWIGIPAFTIIIMLVVKRLIKRDIIAIVRYGTEKLKEYALSATEEGYVLGISRQSFFGTLILGKAKAKISGTTWEHIQQNAKLCSHKPLGEREKEYKRLYVLPEERSKEPVFIRVNKELVLNPRALLREKDAQEIILHNMGKKKGEQIANTQILYNLTVLSHDQQEQIRKLQVKVRNAPEDALQEYARTMMPETRELFYDTYKLLKEKKIDLEPFDSIEADLEAMSKKTKRSEETE